jgi:hypothetical protein
VAQRKLDPRARPQRFEYRSGRKGFTWEGIATKPDPGGNPPNFPRDLQNMRLQGGSLITRPPFAGPGTAIPAIRNFNVDTTSSGVYHPDLGFAGLSLWTPHWLGELNSVGGTRLWWGSTPPLTYVDPPGEWQFTATGGEYGFIDTDMDPVYNDVGIYQSNDNWAPVIERFNREVYIGDYGSIRKIYQLQAPPGLTDGPVDILSEPADEVMLSFPGFRPTSMLEFEGKLYFCLSDPFTLGNAEIWSWDGFQAVQEYVLSDPAAAGSAMAEYKSTLIVTVPFWGSFLELKSGTWSVKTPGGGFDASPLANSMAVYRDKLYIMDGLDAIWSWDGTTATKEYTITAGFAEMGRGSVDALPINAFCCVNFNDTLYFGWTDAAVSPNLVSLGRLDLDNDPAYQWKGAWVNGGYIDTVQDEPGFDGAITAMAVYRGRIWLAAGQYPVRNSQMYSHYVQHAPYAGWWLMDWSIDTSGYPFDGLGPFDNRVRGGVGSQGLAPIYYLRSI